MLYSAQPATQNQGQPAQANQGTPAAGQGTTPAATTAPPRRVIPSDPSSLKKEYYREIKLNTDLTVKLIGKINENQILDSSSFQVVTYKAPGKIQSIACYDRKKKLSLFVLDEPLNMFYYYITFEYQDVLVKSMTLRDQTDQKLWEIRFTYDDKKNIVKGEVWKRETVTGELKLLFFNEYQYYNQGKMFLHMIYNKLKELEEKTYYTPNGKKKRFERYRSGGKLLQYYIVFFYAGNNETKREVYSASNVLLQIIDMRQQNQVSTATVQQPARP